MENAIENKAKFFAQYWGQKVFQFRGGRLSTQKVGTTYMDKYGVTHRHLVLKPLSSITDKDAIEVCNLFQYDNVPTTDFCLSFCKRYMSRVIQSTKAYQYLQSKGYALPFHDLSVEQLIECGWVKLNA